MASVAPQGVLRHQIGRGCVLLLQPIIGGVDANCIKVGRNGTTCGAGCKLAVGGYNHPATIVDIKKTYQGEIHLIFVQVSFPYWEGFPVLTSRGRWPAPLRRTWGNESPFHQKNIYLHPAEWRNPPAFLWTISTLYPFLDFYISTGLVTMTILNSLNQEQRMTIDLTKNRSESSYWRWNGMNWGWGLRRMNQTKFFVGRQVSLSSPLLYFGLADI
jgi:hypothetical protein